MKNLKMVIQYDGTRYKGWQRLGDNDKTIQTKIEDILSVMHSREIKIIGSSRTDAGVHALHQVANFHTDLEMNVDKVMEYCNSYLPKDIVIKEIKEVHERFHSRLNAISKTYCYKIFNSKYHDPFEFRYSYNVTESLDLIKMREASSYFLGEHDFSSFTSLKNKKKSMVRRINYLNIVNNNNLIEIYINGNGFLYNMVRIIVGTVIDVGLNKIHVNEIENIFKSKRRSNSGITVPSKGLFLYNIEY